MTKRFILSILAALFITTTAASRPDDNGQQDGSMKVYRSRTERVRPVLGNNEHLNRTIVFVCENCEIWIPANRNIENIDGRIFCTFTVDTSGKVNSAWVTKGITYWLDQAVTEALMRLPAWKGYLKDDTQKSAKHDIIFTFRRNTGLGYTGINTINNRQQLSMNKYITEARQKDVRERQVKVGRWDKYRYDNMVESMTAEQQKNLKGQTPDLHVKNPESDNTPQYRKVAVTVSIQTD